MWVAVDRRKRTVVVATSHRLAVVSGVVSMSDHPAACPTALPSVFRRSTSQWPNEPGGIPGTTDSERTDQLFHDNVAAKHEVRLCVLSLASGGTTTDCPPSKPHGQTVYASHKLLGNGWEPSRDTPVATYHKVQPFLCTRLAHRV